MVTSRLGNQSQNNGAGVGLGSETGCVGHQRPRAGVHVLKWVRTWRAGMLRRFPMFQLRVARRCSLRPKRCPTMLNARIAGGTSGTTCFRSITGPFVTAQSAASAHSVEASHHTRAKRRELPQIPALKAFPGSLKSLPKSDVGGTHD